MSTGIPRDVAALLNANNKLLGLPALSPLLIAPPPRPLPLPAASLNTTVQPGGKLKPAGKPGGKPGRLAGGPGRAPAPPADSPLGIIVRWAPRFGLDPAAVAAYALEEGGLRWGAVGDQGTSFGPFQAHIGGAAGTRSPQAASAWANSPAGLIEMMRMMARTSARGKTGADAARAIELEFGRGANPPETVRRALSLLPTAERLVRGSKRRPAVVVDHADPIAPLSAAVVKLAAEYVGTPYKYGGASPRTGFDCSGFVQWLYAQKGVRLPRTTFQQVRSGRPVPLDPAGLKPGDLLFFHTENDPRGTATHEGLYIGNGQFVHAPHTGDVVKFSSLNDPYYRRRWIAARRIV